MVHRKTEAYGACLKRADVIQGRYDSMNSTDSYGSARWANENDLAAEGVMAFALPRAGKFASARQKEEFISHSPENRAFILSRLADPSSLLADIRSSYAASMGGLFSGMAQWFSQRQSMGASSNFIGWVGDGHITTIAPTRSGKGIGLVIPNLLNYPGSVIVIDPKGENYAVTSCFRENILGQRIVCLDPFKVCQQDTDCVNPLYGLVDYRKKNDTYLFDNPGLLDEISMIADAMIVRGKDEKDPHWNDKARSLLKGLILGVVCGFGPRRGRHLGEVRRLLLQPLEKFRDMLVEWELKTFVAGGTLSLAALEMQSMGYEELNSVISSAIKHTEFLESEEALRAIGGGATDGFTYDIRNLKKMGNVSIYLIVPPHYLAKYSRLMRIWITSATAAMTRTWGKNADGCPVLFLLDEMAQLGRMEPLVQAVSLLAGYGMTLWMVWQDLAQIKVNYEQEWNSFLANSKIQQYFGVSDYDTAKYVSDMLGEATISVESSSDSVTHDPKKLLFTKSSEGSSTTYSEVARLLLKPDEVRRLNREIMLMFVQGCPPILSKRIAYFKEQEFAGRFERNPYH
jgi:type IV secretion system protein VirD4